MPSARASLRSERTVGRSLADIFLKNKDKRLVIATFSSNVHRVQQIISLSAENGRKVAVIGPQHDQCHCRRQRPRAIMNVPDGLLIDVKDIKRYPESQVTLVTTGSQGEPMSALYRLAFGDNERVTLGQKDLVVISASAIPGNEKSVGKIINDAHRAAAFRSCTTPMTDVHVSGHACREELKLMQALTQSEVFHADSRRAAPPRRQPADCRAPWAFRIKHIFISDIGKVLEIDAKGARFAGTIALGQDFGGWFRRRRRRQHRAARPQASVTGRPHRRGCGGGFGRRAWSPRDRTSSRAALSMCARARS